MAAIYEKITPEKEQYATEIKRSKDRHDLLNEKKKANVTRALNKNI